MSVFLESIVGQLLLNPYIMWRGAQALPTKWLRLLFRLLIMLELMLFFTGYLFHLVLPKDVMAFIITVTGTWYIVSFYMAALVALINLIRKADKRFNHGRLFEGYSRAAHQGIRVALFVFVTAVMTLFTIDSYRRVLHPVVRYHTIPWQFPQGETRQRVRILLLTDLHLSETIKPTHVRNWHKLIQAQQADLLLVGGDIFDFWSYFGYKKDIQQLISQIHAPLGKYFVMGNHEYRADTEQKKRWIQEVGGTLLVDSVAYPAGPLFALIGRDDDTQRHRKPLKRLVQQIDSQYIRAPRVLLEHQPVQLDSLPKYDINLALYGHTHNGQVYPFTWLVRAAFEHAWGYYSKQNSHVIVSAGLGAAGPAMRVLTRSEIVVIDLVRDHQSETQSGVIGTK